jgi:phosphate transport system substrate-binding protein
VFIRTKRFAALAVVTSLALAACGGDSADEPAAEEPSTEDTAEETTATTAAAPASDLSGTLIGAGASSQAAAMQGWQAGFQAEYPNATVEYDPIGSGGGREAFLSGGTMFAGSDAALKDAEWELSKERCAGDLGAINLPHYISPIAIPYNLPSLDGTTLQLSPATIAGIFANEITNWSADEIAADNPGVDLPDLAINPVHRADESGTTENFTDYLAQAAGDVWTYGEIEAWDADGPGGGEGAPQTSGVVAAVAAGEGSIGYADASQIGDLPAAAVGVAGSFVEFSPEAAGRIVDSSERTGGRNEYDFAISVNRTPDSADTYPIALVSYHIVCLEYETQEEVDLVKAFMTYVGSDEGQAASAASAGSAPISPEVQAEIAMSIAAIALEGQSPAAGAVSEPSEEASGIDYSAVSGTLIGAGASSQAAAMQGWQAGFQAVATDATVEYDPIGSGGGREAFLSGGTMFAGSDAALKDAEWELSKERCAGDLGAINLPHYISPIAIPYNLPSLDGTTLQLSPATIAGIFANEITNWSADEIAADNPGVDLPDLAINPVHRADESGTTENFTDYLAQAAGDVWTYGEIEAWDADGPGGGEGAPQTSGVVAAVAAGEGSIGYADASQIGDLPAAAVGVAGSFVEFSPEAAGRIVDSSERTGGRNEYDFAISVNRTPDSADTYPIALVSYHIVCLEYETQEEVDLVKAFMTYVGSDEGQAASAASAGSAPISPEVQAEIAMSIAAITVAG